MSDDQIPKLTGTPHDPPLSGALGRKVNLSEMEREVKRAKRAFDRSLKAKSKGRVSIKIDQLSAAKPKKA